MIERTEDRQLKELQYAMRKLIIKQDRIDELEDTLKNVLVMANQCVWTAQQQDDLAFAQTVLDRGMPE